MVVGSGVWMGMTVVVSVPPPPLAILKPGVLRSTMVGERGPPPPPPAFLSKGYSSAGLKTAMITFGALTWTVVCLAPGSDTSPSQYAN